jgi:hypothetical protein
MDVLGIGHAEYSNDEREACEGGLAPGFSQSPDTTKSIKAYIFIPSDGEGRDKGFRLSKDYDAITQRHS